MFCLYICLCAVCLPACGGQKRALDVMGLELLTGDCELQCRCEEPNPGPLQEQPLILASETSLKPPRSEDENDA